MYNSSPVDKFHKFIFAGVGNGNMGFSEYNPVPLYQSDPVQIDDIGTMDPQKAGRQHFFKRFHAD